MVVETYRVSLGDKHVRVRENRYLRCVCMCVCVCVRNVGNLTYSTHNFCLATVIIVSQIRRIC